MPIIPLANPPLDFAKLRLRRLAEDRIAEYPILLNQPILGLNPNWIESEFRNKSDRALAYAIDLMETKWGKKFHPTGKPVHLNKVVWFWIPSDDEVNRLSGASNSGRLSVEKWGFAFNV
jgi:hypothetical protein